MKKEFILKNRVKMLRLAREMRQQDLAREAGVARQTIISIEKGRFVPSTYLALRLASVLQKPFEQVFYLVTQENNDE